jgi:hypothetical protein
MAICWLIKSVAKVTPKRIPKYLTGSPTSILIANQAMHHSRFAETTIV